MSQDAYRAPEAPLIRPDAPLEPRSPVVAVVLGLVVDIVLSGVLGLALGLLGVSVDEVSSGPPAFLLNAGTGFMAGWVAARHRRGPWLGVTLGVIAVDLLFTLGALALGLPGMPDTFVAALVIVVWLTATVAGGYTGRGWRTAAARPR